MNASMVWESRRDLVSSAGLIHRLPLLVTGISGVAGLGALRYFQRRHPGQVFGIRSEQTANLNGPGIIPLDMENAPGLRELFRARRFGSVLNCAGNCALKSCELDPAMAARLNVESAAVLVDLAREHGARLVHLSSDLVYSGVGAGNYREDDPVDPVTVYGKTMAEGERIIQSGLPETAILRISLPMGPSFNRHAGAIDWIQSRFRHGRPATLYFDEVRSCAYVEDLSRVFERFLVGDEHGLYHAGGPRAMTLYRIAQVVNRVGDYDPRLLHGMPRIQAGPMPPRAGNVSMCSEKLHRLLGGDPFEPWPSRKEHVPTDGEWHWYRPVDEERGLEAIRAWLYGYGCGLRAGA